VSLSSSINIGFSDINSDFTGAANRAAIRQLFIGIGQSIPSVTNAHKDTKLLAESLIELIRSFTEGDGKSSRRSSHEDLIMINPEIFLENQFNTSRCKKNFPIQMI
jgi:hypothetical protein